MARRSAYEILHEIVLDKARESGMPDPVPSAFWRSSFERKAHTDSEEALPAVKDKPLSLNAAFKEPFETLRSFLIENGFSEEDRRNELYHVLDDEAISVAASESILRFWESSTGPAASASDYQILRTGQGGDKCSRMKEWAVRKRRCDSGVDQILQLNYSKWIKPALQWYARGLSVVDSILKAKADNDVQQENAKKYGR